MEGASERVLGLGFGCKKLVQSLCPSSSSFKCHVNLVTCHDASHNRT